MKLFFSNYFNLNRKVIEDYGAVDVSLISDIPLFIDPFLIFYSDKDEYKKLHSEIIDYLFFLKSKSNTNLNTGELRAWFKFSEISQNWLGYSSNANKGRGLWIRFAKHLNNNLQSILESEGKSITKSSHLEKACLLEKGVGRDGISDFATNLIKRYLLEFTEKFALKNLKSDQLQIFSVDRTVFDKNLQKWMPKQYTLPAFNEDYVLLTPVDILTKQDMWINKDDFSQRLMYLPNAVENEQLRAEINNYIRTLLAEKSTDKEYKEAVTKAAIKYPILMDVYIKQKEDSGDEAQIISNVEVNDIKFLFNQGAEKAVEYLEHNNFYNLTEDSFSESMDKLLLLKKFIEIDGYRFFYNSEGQLISRQEKDLQLLYKLVWRADRLKKADINPETNHGRGPVDFAVSNSAKDKTLVEFKIATSTKLRQNLLKQVETYKLADTANQNSNKIYAITYFTEKELARVNHILDDLKLNTVNWIVLIDSRNDNKESGSNSK